MVLKKGSQQSHRNHFCFHKEPFIQSFSHHKEAFVRGSSDVKGSLWNHLDKKKSLWHREAPLFLRVKQYNSLNTLTCLPIVTLRSVKAAVDSFTFSNTDTRLSTLDLLIISYSTFIKGLCVHHWLLKLKPLISLLNWLLKPLVSLLEHQSLTVLGQITPLWKRMTERTQC